MQDQTRLGAVSRGLVAGSIGTLAMDLLWFRRHRRGGGTSSFLDWEFSSGATSWEEASAPARVGERLLKGVLRRPIPTSRINLVGNVMHWSYGLAWGALYALGTRSIGSWSIGRCGIAFGSIVWAGDYVVLPPLGVYAPIWNYDAKTLWDDLSAHLVYGTGTVMMFRVLAAK